MKKLKSFHKSLLQPIVQKNYLSEVLLVFPRIICGLLLSTSFGADKFGMPWSPPDKNLGLFEVVSWFPQDVETFGGIFSLAPVFFAWMGAASEAIGGLFLALGLYTRVSAGLIACTMLTAIFFQKWGQGMWSMLPALGFLWVACYSIVLGSGRLGLDNYISNSLIK